MPSEKINIVFPIETMVREFDSRVFLASSYIKKHHRIFLAHTPQANYLASHLKGGGLYIGKHIFATGGAEPIEYHRAKENGFKIIHLAEEGAVFMGGPEDWKFDLDWQLRPKVLAPDDYLATWGEWQKNYYISQGAPTIRNIRATGHPRFDIYKSHHASIYENEAQKYVSRYGEFILINSNFSYAVNPLGRKDTFSSWQGYYPAKEKDRIRFIERWSKQNQIFAQFIELVHKISVKYSEYNIVIRPHPSDDIEQIRTAVSGVKNIHVVREGNVVPWILASKLLIHEGCTTAIEAYMLKKPVLNFAPIPSAQQGFLPSSVSINVNNLDDACVKVSAIIEGQKDESELPDMAHQLFANFKTDSVKEFTELMNEAEANLVPSKLSRMHHVILQQFQHYLIESSKHLARRAFFEERYRSALSIRVLFPGFNKNFIDQRIRLIGKVTGNHMSFRLYSPWLLELYL
jgi:surface carbohydrate biosynthesis protein